MKILFACDLDGTLIHSHKKFRDGDICVELYDGHEQSFMSPKSLDLLKKLAAQIFFVPITTRSIAQYRRIFWTEDFRPKFAVVANGAYLLDGERCKNFLREVVDEKISAELETLREKFSSDERFNICRIVDESFLFLRRRDDFDGEISFDTDLIVGQTGKKIYLFPPKLNKGAALTKLAYKLSADKIFCAGDSEIDLPMLELADVAFSPKNLCEKNFVTCSDAPLFAEEFLQRLDAAITSDLSGTSAR